MQIIVKSISHIFNKNTPLEYRALYDSSCNINQGEYVAIIGQTGSGKTTFIEHLNSLLTPETGSINWIFEHEYRKKKNLILGGSKSPKNDVAPLIDSKNVTLQKQKFRKKFKESKMIRQHVGVVFQFAEYQLFESTIEKDIMFGPLAYGVPKEEAKRRAKIYLEKVGLPEDYLHKNPLALSGGQKRRVALAGILAIEPDVLILDEPTAGLDPAGVREILSIFDKLNEEGKTIIMVTHDMNNVLERSHRTIVFSNGQIVRDDATVRILNDEVFLKMNNLIAPQIIALINRIKEKKPYLNFPEITKIEQLTDFLNKKIKDKKGETNE
ncbi:energy-coupling factor transporter ATPase [Mycoplasmopsis agassizii]|uniref:Energy-coupling factor transporter ATP-binding protein EcfA2 n=1 Tax=Mycoplasmopsis agassizii TaxID=33922 RepID=A0A269TIE8_9BACT|nr:energy-coupling factor transporter ATPase [Mycoplasmopsis agassizii]PAK20950.1 energy-coupling factor transporter ATPase [Mycoplasmopsis agassizii]